MSILPEYLAVLLLDGALGDSEEELGGSVRTIAAMLSAELDTDFDEKDISDALKTLEPFGASERDFSPLTGGFWHIKYDNFRYYFKESLPDEGDDADNYEKTRAIAEKFPVLMAYARRGRPYAIDAKSALRGISSSRLDELRSSPSTSPAIGHIPASDRLVTINHNSQEYAQVVTLTEAAAESVRGSNSLDEDSRGWIKVHLDAGLKFIANNKILATAASALLLQPLLKAYEAVTEEPAKQAILAAIKVIRAFFGIN